MVQLYQRANAQIICTLCDSRYHYHYFVIQAHTIITWDVVVGGWDIEYAAYFVPGDVERLATMLENPKNMEVTDLAVRRHYTAKEPGKLVLSINNKASWKTKFVAYRYQMQESLVYIG